MLEIQEYEPRVGLAKLFHMGFRACGVVQRNWVENYTVYTDPGVAYVKANPPDWANLIWDARLKLGPVYLFSLKTGGHDMVVPVDEAFKVGDVVLVLYDKKVGKGSYKLGRVTAIHPDAHAHGVVRTIIVGMERTDKREPSLPYKSVPLSEVKLGVQRVAVICPVEEQAALDNPASSEKQEVQGARGDNEQSSAVIPELLEGKEKQQN